ncbi:tubby-related protein 4-like [Tropilaelaps mercedesae]|uniref:Tubby-related protein 4-like n=1 Tax=Tropilaelaps mercedesae TaxID=418985 RepID=A0A1V9XJY8_9ACAR|nr:tubby-related protein 4-like [Tropilaelaps mercedesae]
MAWSCEKFKMEETDVDQPVSTSSEHPMDQGHPLGGSGNPSDSGPPGVPHAVLAVAFATGVIYLMKNYDDLSPIVVHTGLKGIKLEWSNSGETLAVAGVAEPEPGFAAPAPGSYRNLAKFYTAETGSLRFVASIPCAEKPVTALTWGHNDKRLFIATGNVIHIAWVTRRMASLQLLSRLTIHKALKCEQEIARLHLPARLRALVANLFGQTVKCTLPQPERLREFVSRPPGHNVRLHCTVVRHDEDAAAGSATYTLFLEFLGGLVPLLKGRRASKLRPEFVIYDPQAEQSQHQQQQNYSSCSGFNSSCSSQATPNVSGQCTPAASSDSDAEDGATGCHASPRVQRRRRFRKHLLNSGMLPGGGSNSTNSGNNGNNNNNNNSINFNGQHGCLANQQGLGTKTTESRDSSTQRKENTYVDQLPESDKMVAITSNIWGTKFKLLSLVDWLPAVLGMVSYRTSLLHLQPRQMTLIIKELQGPKPHSNTRLCPDSKSKGGTSQSTPSFSEDDDDLLPCFVLEAKKISSPALDRNYAAACLRQKPEADNSGHGVGGGSQGGTGGRAAESPPPIAPMTPKKQRCALTYAQMAAHDPELDGDNEMHVAEEVLSFTRTSHPSTLQISLQHGSFGAPSTTSTTSSSAVIQSVATQTSLHSLNDLSTGNPTPNGPTSMTMTVTSTGGAALGRNTAKAVATISSDPSRETSPVPGPSRLSGNPLDQPSSSSSPSTSSCSSTSARRLQRNSFNSSPTRKVIKRNSRIDPDQASPVEDMTYSTTSEIVRAVHTPEPRWAEKASDIKYIDNEEDVSDMVLVQIPVEGTERRLNGLVSTFAASDSIGSTTAPSVVIRDTSLRRPPTRSDTTKRLTLRSAPTAGSPSKGGDQDGSRTTTTDGKTAACLVDEPGCCCEACQATDDERGDSRDSGNHRVSKTCNSPTALQRNRSNHTSGSNSPLTTSSSLLRTQSSCIGDPLVHHHHHHTNHVMSGFPGHHLAAGPAPLMNPLSSATSASILESGVVRLDTETGSAIGALGMGGSLSPSLTPPASPPVSRSTPTTPDLNNRRRNKKQSINHLKALLYSPLLLRKVRKHSLRSTIESSDDENSTPAGSSEDVISISDGFRDLESLQKAYIRKKLKKRQGGNGKVHTQEMLPGAKAEQEARIKPSEPVYREFTLHNKAPLWNEVSQVYQLDFGGRVTQESAKNFQIEFKGTQVMQFGRIDGNAYTLDFQYPFSALQAFAVALANVTQRLK